MEIAVTSLTLISSNNPLPAPALVNMTQGYSENYEGRLVRFNNVSFTTSGTFAGNTNYNISDGANTGQVRVNGSSNIVGTPIPSGNIDVVGIMGQFGNTYQLLVRKLDDFITIGNPPVFTTSLKQSNIQTTSFTVSFSTQSNGNTIIKYGLTANNLNQTAFDATQTTNHSINLTGLTAGTIYYLKGFSVSATGDTSSSAIQAMATKSLSSGDIKVYFNRSVDNTVSTGTDAIHLNQALDDTLIAYIGRAKYTLDIAIYNVDNANNIITAINQAAANGVTVRVIGDDGISATNWNSFSNAISKIKSPTGSEYGIMHNKMVIIDANSANPNDPIYWTGSANFTTDQINIDAQNVIIFQDQSIARAALIEFNEMFNNTFGPYKTDNTPKEFVIGNKRVEMYFSPSDVVNAQVKNALLTANNSINYCIYAFTRTEQAYAIKDAYTAGASIVQGLVNDTANATLPYNIIVGAIGSANHRIFPFSYLLHHKYAIIDAFDVNSDPQVITGSYNWSNSATFRNDENIVIVHDATIANIYFQEFSQRFKDSGGSLIVSDDYKTAVPDRFLIYPNPASDILHISASIQAPQFSLNLMDINGRVIQQNNFSQSSINTTLDLSSLSNGIYLLQITSGKVNKTIKVSVAH
jgi:phosphatidylserine/phosphatidylglycerophosphate/cardiolipin synthase-like enzyme